MIWAAGSGVRPTEYYALPNDVRRAFSSDELEANAPGCRELYRQAEELDEQSNAIFDRICKMKPVTPAGVIAMLASA